MVILIYMDDILISGNNDKVTELKEYPERFHIKDVEPTNAFLVLNWQDQKKASR